MPNMEPEPETTWGRRGTPPNRSFLNNDLSNSLGLCWVGSQLLLSTPTSCSSSSPGAQYRPGTKTGVGSFSTCFCVCGSLFRLTFASARAGIWGSLCNLILCRLEWRLLRGGAPTGHSPESAPGRKATVQAGPYSPRGADLGLVLPLPGLVSCHPSARAAKIDEWASHRLHPRNYPADQRPMHGARGSNGPGLLEMGKEGTWKD